MLDKEQTIEKLRSTRQYLDEHYGVHSMMLFGSLAKGLQHEGSDVDVCVEMVPNLFKQAGIKAYLEEINKPKLSALTVVEASNLLLRKMSDKNEWNSKC